MLLALNVFLAKSYILENKCMAEITICRKSLTKENIGCYYCIYFDQGRYWELLLKVCVCFVLYFNC